MSQSTIYVRYIILFMQWSFGMKVCAYFRLICCWLICLDLMGTVSSVQWCSGYHARFTRERSWVRPPVEPGNVFLRRTKLLRYWQRNLHMHTDGSWLRTSTVVVAEWLRRWTRNPLGSSRAGSNPADNATFCCLFDCYVCCIFPLIEWIVWYSKQFSIKYRPRRDSNSQSSDPKSDALSIRPRGPTL